MWTKLAKLECEDSADDRSKVAEMLHKVRDIVLGHLQTTLLACLVCGAASCRAKSILNSLSLSLAIGHIMRIHNL